MEEEEEAKLEYEDVAAGPDLQAEVEEKDEEGRFFGSGVSADTRQAMDYIEGFDEADDAADDEVIDGAWLRKMVVGFERKINRNAELRAKFEDQPEKYDLLPSAPTSLEAQN